MTILAIDPGNIESAYCFIDSETYKPSFFAKVPNEELLELIMNSEIDDIVIEMIASYGMPVGESVFQTCVWIGKFAQASNLYEKYVYRKDEKMNLCHSMKAKDSNIRQALIDRFGEVGTKRNPRMVLSVSKLTFGLLMQYGVTYLDKKKGLYKV